MLYRLASLNKFIALVAILFSQPPETKCNNVKNITACGLRLKSVRFLCTVWQQCVKHGMDWIGMEWNGLDWNGK